MNAKKGNNEIGSTGKTIVSVEACSCLIYRVLLLQNKIKKKERIKKAKHKQKDPSTKIKSGKTV